MSESTSMNDHISDEPHQQYINVLSFFYRVYLIRMINSSSTSRNIDGNLHFEDVVGVILEEESMWKSKVDKVESSKQPEALTMMRGRSTNINLVGVRFVIGQSLRVRGISNRTIMEKGGMSRKIVGKGRMEEGTQPHKVVL